MLKNKIWIEKINNKHLYIYFQKDNIKESYFIKSLSGESLSTSFESLRIIAALVSLPRKISNLVVPGPIDDLLRDSIPLATDLLNEFGNSSIFNSDFNFSDISEIIYHSPKIKESKIKVVKSVATFFTGGVDSFYTLLKNKSEITDVIFVHGLDIKLEDKLVRKDISLRLKKICNELKLNLIELETNLRTIYDNCNISWELAHGNALGGIAHFLDNYFKKVYIPSSYTYKDFFPWGSHPSIDYLWSTTKLEIVHDGCELNRHQKIELISNYDVVLENLNVCWKNKSDESINCGECEKCQRTMISLSIIKKLKYCKTLPSDIKAEDLVFNLVSLQNKSKFSFIRILYDELKKIKDLKKRGELFLIYKKIKILLQAYYFNKNISKI